MNTSSLTIPREGIIPIGFLAFIIALVLLLWRAPGLEFYLSSSDHGFQLCMARQVILGKLPFVDVFSHYGPLVSFTSALLSAIHDSLLSETLLCAVGYAASLSLVYRLTVVVSSRLVGWCVFAAGFVFVARFYKWYYWFFPLAALYCFYRIINTPLQRRTRWILSAGLIDGIAALYRLDLGLACAAFHVLSLGAASVVDRTPRRYCSELLYLSAGISVPIVCWFAFLVTHAGVGGIGDYFWATVSGAQGVVEFWSKPFPLFDRYRPFSVDSASAAAFVVVPLIYVSAAMWALRVYLRDTNEEQLKKGLFVLATALIGACTFPQALHRSDIQHLKQVIPPAIISAGILFSILWADGSIAARHGFRRRLAVGLCAAFATGLIVAIGERGGADLASWSSSPLQRYRDLSKGPAPNVTHPIGKLAMTIRTSSHSNEAILVLGIAPQVYYFSRRPMAGIFPVYCRGLWTESYWRRKDLATVQKNSPLYVMVPTRDERNLLQEERPLLFNWIMTTYGRTVTDLDSWVLLKRQVE
ncbi:MAG: hypothetical protein RDU20_01975 [Desulfomonilaceae bacterium]|nr:hypothetical protein [Desulfomonilaceae bacterium]